MEKNPSPAFRNSPPMPDVRETAPPSLVRRTMRTLLAPVLLGGALAAGAALPSADVAAQGPVKEERKEENPLLAKLRQEIPPLIADLDSDSFRVREQAQRRLEQIVLGWVREKQQVFPLIASLAMKGGYSLEQQRRLGRILDAHEREELRLLWRPTIFREPPEWKERKGSPTVREVLAALEKQTGRKISMDSPQGLAESAVMDKLDGRTFWEALERAGKKCMVYRGHDGSFSLWADERGIRATSGNVLGQAHVRHCHPFDQTRQIGVQFLMEPLLLPGGAFVTKADGITDKGRKVACGVDELGNITLPFEEGEQSVDLTVTACLRGYETRVETVRDLTKVAKFPVRANEIQILGKTKPADRFPMYWCVNAQMSGEGKNEYERWHLMSTMKCRGFDAKGVSIPMPGFNHGRTECQWEFCSEPHSLELTLPGRMTTAEKTLTFKGIPLN